MAKVHEFGSTGEACDAAQTDAAIEDGDVLLVRPEHAMAVICQTRPVAVDGFTGRAFHEHDKTWDWSAVKHPTGIGSDTVRDYSESARLARRSGQKAGCEKAWSTGRRTAIRSMFTRRGRMGWRRCAARCRH